MRPAEMSERGHHTGMEWGWVSSVEVWRRQVKRDREDTGVVTVGEGRGSPARSVTQ